MRFLFLAEADSANSGSLLARALRTQGHEVKGYCAGSHPFQYPDQLEEGIPDDDEIERLIDWSQCVTLIQSMLPKRLWVGGNKWLERIKPKPIVLTHGGSHYRQEPALYVAAYREYTNACICYEADLMGHFPNEHLIIPPVDLKWFQPRKIYGPMRVGHFPSNAEKKGTAEIVPVNQKYRHLTSTSRVDWFRQLDRVADCDVLVDQIEPRIGEWVTMAAEAAALGLVSIANSHNTQPYIDTYGEAPGIHICNTIQELEVELDRLSRLTRPALEKEKHASRAWIERRHTLEKTGEILMQKVYGPLL